MYSYSPSNRRLRETFKSILKMQQRSSVRPAAKYSLNSLRYSLNAAIPETSSTSRTSGATTGRGMHSMPTGPQPRLKSSMVYTKRASKSCRSLFQSRRNKRRVPSKMVRLAYRLCAPKAFPRAPVIMDYSTLESFLSAHSPRLGKTKWSSTTSSMYPRPCLTTRSKFLLNKWARKNTFTSAKTLRSIAFATRAYVDHASMASEPMVLMRLK